MVKKKHAATPISARFLYHLQKAQNDSQMWIKADHPKQLSICTNIQWLQNQIQLLTNNKSLEIISKNQNQITMRYSTEN